MKDPPLLEFAQARFDVFITVDRGLPNQCDMSTLKLGIIIARVLNNRLDGFEPILDQLNAAIEKIKAGQVVHIVSPAVRR
jgi:hypothetical protein